MKTIVMKTIVMKTIVAIGVVALTLAASGASAQNRRCTTSFGLTTCSNGDSYFNFDAYNESTQRQWRQQQQDFDAGAREQRRLHQEQHRQFQLDTCPLGIARNGGRC